jgi:hypothetical protein
MKTQETLEEVAEILIFKTIGGNYGLASSDEHDQVDGYFDTYLEAFITLKLKWQQGRMYSEEEVKRILMKTGNYTKISLDVWFEQFKKK